MASVAMLALMPARADARVIASSAKETAVSAEGAIVVWSRAVGSRFVLMGSVRGKAMRFAVRSRKVQFDADVGSDARGRPVVTYSRCRSEPPRGTGRRFRTLLPAYSSARGCDLYLYDVLDRRERRVASLSRGDASEYLPSAFRGRIAFARIYERRPVPKGLLPYVYLASLSGGRATVLPGGPRGWYAPRNSDSGLLRLPNGGGGPGPVRLELGPGGLGLGWAYAPTDPQLRACESLPENGAAQFPFIFQARWVRGRTSRLLAQTCDQDDPRLVVDPAPGRDGSLTYATLPLFTRCATLAVTRTRPDGRSATIRPSVGREGLVVSLAYTEDRSYLSVVDLSGTRTTIVDVGRLQFGAAVVPAAVEPPFGPGCPP